MPLFLIFQASWSLHRPRGYAQSMKSDYLSLSKAKCHCYTLFFRVWWILVHNLAMPCWRGTFCLFSRLAFVSKLFESTVLFELAFSPQLLVCCAEPDHKQKLLHHAWLFHCRDFEVLSWQQKLVRTIISNKILFYFWISWKSDWGLRHIPLKKASLFLVQIVLPTLPWTIM